MRVKSFLTEDGMQAPTLVRNRGEKLFWLINKIQNGEWLAISNTSTLYRDGVRKVKVHPQSAEELMKVAFKDGNPDNAVFDENNRLVPYDNSRFRLFRLRSIEKPYLELSYDEFYKVKRNEPGVAPIPVGSLSPSPNVKVSDEKESEDAPELTVHNMNKGVIAEIALGAALTARAMDVKMPVSPEDIYSIIMRSGYKEEVKDNARGAMTEVSLRSKLEGHESDNLEFVIRVQSQLFATLMLALKNDDLDDQYKVIFQSAAKFINSKSQPIMRLINGITQNKKIDLLKITSIASSNKKQTTADLHVELNGTPINLLSIKAQAGEENVQFGQKGMNDGTTTAEFFKETFNITLPSEIITQLNELSGKQNKKARSEYYRAHVYSTAADIIRGKLTNDAAEAGFVKDVYAGIRRHGTYDNDDIDIVILSSSISAPEYKLLKFGQKLLEAMSYVKLTASAPGGTSLIVHAVDVEPEFKAQRGGDDVLITVMLRQSGDALRNIVALGGLLKKLAAVEDEEEGADK